LYILLFCAIGNVPYGRKLTEKYKPLASWVAMQQQYLAAYDKDPSSTASTMTPERRQRLFDLGFVQSTPSEQKWEKKFNLLQEFKEECGHCK
jgi:hypothetical protein